jgi:rare lipoprotein A
VATGRPVTVRINDRGPFVRSRVVDVSASAARTHGITGKGHGEGEDQRDGSADAIK